MFVEYLDKKFYSEFKDNWDDLLLRKIILRYIKQSDTLLDLGAGAGIVDFMNFKGLCKKVIGIDLDRRVLNNRFLDEAFVSSVYDIPFPNETFDIVISNNVIEHLQDPKLAFKEIDRVLKKGGLFIFKTPNKYHYVKIFSNITPLWFHEFFNKLRGRCEHDTFPTFYLANSRKDVKKIISNFNFDIEQLECYEGRPEYLRINSFLYLFGIFYEKIVNSMAIFQDLRVIIIGVLRKKYEANCSKL